MIRWLPDSGLLGNLLNAPEKEQKLLTAEKKAEAAEKARIEATELAVKSLTKLSKTAVNLALEDEESSDVLEVPDAPAGHHAE